jgi:hypothetical protein
VRWQSKLLRGAAVRPADAALRCYALQCHTHMLTPGDDRVEARLGHRLSKLRSDAGTCCTHAKQKDVAGRGGNMQANRTHSKHALHLTTAARASTRSQDHQVPPVFVGGCSAQGHDEL